MTALFEVTETDDDDSFTTCQGCDKIFDNEDRLPLNLDCQHSMCITCIKRKSSINKVVYCSTCPGKTIMVNRNAFDLKTNHCMLRLIAAEQKKVKLRADYVQLKIDSVRNKIWCSDCHEFGNGCSVGVHKTGPLLEFFNKSLDNLKSDRQDLFVSWNQIVGNLEESQNILQHVAGSISSVLKLIQKRMEENDILMRQIKSSKTESGELPTVPHDLDLSDEELKILAHKLEAMAHRMKIWKDEVNPISSHQQLDILVLMENFSAVIQLEKKNPQTSSRPVPQISMPLKLPLSFTTSENAPHFNDCVSVLSFLLSIVAEEEAKSSTQASQDSSSSRAEKSDVGDLTSSVPSSATGRQATIICNSSDFHESVLSDTQEKSRGDVSDESDSDSFSSMESQPLGVRGNQLNEQKSALLHREDSDAESNVSDQSSISARSVMSTKSAQSAISRQSDGSSMCEQSRVTVQFSRSAQSGTSVQASKCTPAGKSSRPLRSVRKNGAVYHTKLFKCGECGKCFKEKSNLKRHVFAHSDERPFKCQYYRKLIGFKDKSNLKQHSAVHSDERPFKCQYCLKGFKFKSNLKQHATIHSDDRPFKCQYCQKGFKDKSNLKQHAAIHSDDRPFKCQYCLKDFKYKSNLKQHAAIHTSERPYRCQYCLEDFLLSGDMKRHANLCSSRPAK